MFKFMETLFVKLLSRTPGGLTLLCCQSADNQRQTVNSKPVPIFMPKGFDPIHVFPSRWSVVFPPTCSQTKLIPSLQVRLDTSGYPQTVISR